MRVVLCAVLLIVSLVTFVLGIIAGIDSQWAEGSFWLVFSFMNMYGSDEMYEEL